MTARQAGATTAAARWTWVDLRLAPVAATVWLTSLVAPWLAPALLFGVAGAASCVAAAVGRRRGTATATVALAVLAAAVVSSGIAAARGAAREASPLRAAAEAGRTALVQLELDSDPRLMPAAGPPRVVADATVTLLSDDASTARMHAAVLLFAPADAWEGLLPSQQVSVRVRTSMPQPGSDRVAVVSARGPPTLVGKPGALQRAAGALRGALAASSGRVLDDRSAGLLPGLVVGDTRAMDPVLESDFRRAGLSHLTAVSGDDEQRCSAGCGHRGVLGVASVLDQRRDGGDDACDCARQPCEGGNYGGGTSSV